MKISKNLVMGIFLAATSQLVIGQPSHLWLPLNTADSALEVDYNSIQLQGAAPSLLIKQKFTQPVSNGNLTYSALVHHYSVDCDNQLLIRSVSKIFKEEKGSDEGEEIKPAIGNDRVPLGPLKSICVWRDHGFSVPDIGVTEDWEEMDSPISTNRVFEAPKKRQRKNGFVLIKQKNEGAPNILIKGVPSHIGVMENLYDCVKQEAHVTFVVAYDLALKPIFIEFYREQSSMPKLEANRDRFASACQ